MAELEGFIGSYKIPERGSRFLVVGSTYRLSCWMERPIGSVIKIVRCDYSRIDMVWKNSVIVNDDMFRSSDTTLTEDALRQLYEFAVCEKHF